MADDKINIDLNLDMEYREARMKYYRQVLQKQDQEVLKRLQKIPDDWNSINPDLPIASIPDDQKAKLSDLKRLKSWELKFEAIYFHYLTTAEETVLSLMKQRDVSREEIDEAIESIEALSLEVGNTITDFKQLMMNLAKRQISDFYYLMISFFKFNKIPSEGFDKDFLRFRDMLIVYIEEHRTIPAIIEDILFLKNEISKFYEKSSSTTGWKMKENAVRDLLQTDNKQSKKGSAEKKSDESQVKNNPAKMDLAKLNRIVTQSFLYSKRLKKDFLFLTYYYNETDGKLFRIIFVIDSFRQKLYEGKISQAVYGSFLEIKDSFLKVKNNFEWKGLSAFGSKEIMYGEIIEIIYRSAKVIEQCYLRAANYDRLRNFRDDTLYKLENEYFYIYPERRRR